MRGGQTDAEIAHADDLLGAEAESIWGWAMPAGQRRVAARVAWFAQDPHELEDGASDFLHPSTPAPLIRIVEGLQAVAEALPGIRRISGSLWVSGYRPGGERT